MRDGKLMDYDSTEDYAILWEPRFLRDKGSRLGSSFGRVADRRTFGTQEPRQNGPFPDPEMTFPRMRDGIKPVWPTKWKPWFLRDKGRRLGTSLWYSLN